MHSWPGTVVVLLVGLVVGFWAGGFTGCVGKGCEFRVDSMEALGTWVGGLGTIAAVMYAAAGLRREHETQVEAAVHVATERRRRDQVERHDAGLVTISCQIGSSIPYPPNVQVNELRVIVENGANTAPLFKLRGDLPGFDALHRERRVSAGATATTHFRKPHTMNMPFSIGSGEERRFELSRAAEVSIIFEMHDRVWSRVGDGPVEEIFGHGGPPVRPT